MHLENPCISVNLTIIIAEGKWKHDGGGVGMGLWCFNKTCSWEFSAIILTYWNLLTILDVKSKAAKRKEGRTDEDRCASVTETPAAASNLEK